MNHKDKIARIDRRISNWQKRKRSADGQGPHVDAPWKPLICLARQTGAGGENIARQVATLLELEYWDTALVREIAERSDARRALIETLDEHVHSRIEDFVNAFVLPKGTDSEYLRHLTTVAHGLESSGGALIVGRGAHCIVASERSLRVNVVCPLARRISRYAKLNGIEEGQAQQAVEKTDAERAAYLVRSFHQTPTAVLDFDLTINTGQLSFDAAAHLIAVAYRQKFAHIQ